MTFVYMFICIIRAEHPGWRLRPAPDWFSQVVGIQAPPPAHQWEDLRCTAHFYLHSCPTKSWKSEEVSRQHTPSLCNRKHQPEAAVSQQAEDVVNWRIRESSSPWKLCEVWRKHLVFHHHHTEVPSWSFYAPLTLFPVCATHVFSGISPMTSWFPSLLSGATLRMSQRLFDPKHGGKEKLSLLLLLVVDTWNEEQQPVWRGWTLVGIYRNMLFMAALSVCESLDIYRGDTCQTESVHVNLMKNLSRGQTSGSVTRLVSIGWTSRGPWSQRWILFLCLKGNKIQFTAWKNTK